MERRSERIQRHVQEGAAFLKWVLYACGIGLLVGAVAVAFHYGIDWAAALRQHFALRHKISQTAVMLFVNAAYFIHQLFWLFPHHNGIRRHVIRQKRMPDKRHQPPAGKIAVIQRREHVFRYGVKPDSVVGRQFLPPRALHDGFF